MYGHRYAEAALIRRHAGNPQCVAPRCTETGKCGVDTINHGYPCVPIDGRATGGYNEVFIGAPTWYGNYTYT